MDSVSGLCYHLITCLRLCSRFGQGFSQGEWRKVPCAAQLNLSSQTALGHNLLLCLQQDSAQEPVCLTFKAAVAIRWSADHWWPMGPERLATTALKKSSFSSLFSPFLEGLLLYLSHRPTAKACPLSLSEREEQFRK